MQGERLRSIAAFLWLSLLFLYACLSGTTALPAEAKIRESGLISSYGSEVFSSFSPLAAGDNPPYNNPFPSGAPGGSASESSSHSQLVPNSETEKNLPTTSFSRSSRIAYLTFDDGPSEEVTPAILNILKQFEVKATFFVVGRHAERHPQIIKQIMSEGHALGNHSYSHKINYIYRNPQTLLEDIRQCEKILNQITGTQPRLFRAPGGSVPYLKSAAIQALQEAGYRYFDWNVCPGDSDGKPHTAEELVEVTLQQASNKERIIVLLHDSYPMANTIEALPAIIEGLQKMGFTFEILTPETEPIHFASHSHRRNRAN